RWLLTEPNSIGIRPAQTTHPTRIKAGKRIIYFTRPAYARARISSMRRRRREHSLLLKASKILLSLGASVNLTLSHRRRALRLVEAPGVADCMGYFPLS